MDEIRYETREFRIVSKEVVGIIDGVVVSRAVISWQESDGPEEMHLDSVWVESEVRGRKIGSHLMERVMRISREHGAKVLKGTFRAERWARLFGLYVRHCKGLVYGHAFAIPVDDPDGALRQKYVERASHLPFRPEQ